MIRTASAILLLSLVLGGCKVIVVAPPHVAVVSEDMEFACMPGQTCEIDVSDYKFDMVLYAVPKPGYSFLYWKSGAENICPGFYSNKCHISTLGADQSNEALNELLSSERRFYLEPVYRRDETAPDVDWESIEGG